MMDKLNTLVTMIISLFGACFLGIIVYVSILGDNHKIDYLVEQLFTDIRERNFDAVCPVLSSDVTGIQVNTPEECMDVLFLLELCLLKHYNLEDRSDYTLDISTSHLWIPYITSDTISVSIALSETKNTLIDNIISSPSDKTHINDFITIERQKGTWRIKTVNIPNSSISSEFTALKETLDLDRYVTVTADGYILNQHTINTDTLSAVDRRLLEFSLFKLSMKKAQDSKQGSMLPILNN